MEKTCNKCDVTKPLEEFTKRKSSPYGRGNTCKICTRNYMVIYQETNLEKLSEYHKQYKLENKEKNKEYLSIYNTKQEVKIKKREYYDNNIQFYRNLEKTEERKKYRYFYNKTIPHIRGWYGVLHNSLVRLGKKKENHTIDLLGYSAIELKLHLELLFTDGMSWDNYGEWHVDHIKPVSKFDSETPMNIVNVLSNLQPLWATTREINGVLYEGNINKHNN